ncbi:MAG: molybdenum cofactor biosynthesis enzyme [Eggerthellaceae bacterium]|jgi:hypothetical protein|nr:molybdenum cofactor biosynthesis enzyme [Eggerthellaceae bacterium]MDR2715309.1 hypothetical protein [Coriobacteriaceae bacterium]
MRNTQKAKKAARLQQGARPQQGPRPQRDPFHDEEGFSTVGMVVALLVTLTLIFSTAQVYQVNSAAATIQNVADAAVLAAENEVAEFYVVAQVCDAVVLSLSLTGTAAYGLGVAALCTPVTAGFSEILLKAGTDIFKARNSFAEKSAAGLNLVQKLLPFLSAANAESVVRANSGGPIDTAYAGLALLLPFDGEEIVVGPTDAAKKLEEEVAKNKDELGREAREAEEAARRANAEKERAFRHDCGNSPGYCMYDRADRLAALPSSSNPLYRSVETWNFSVAMKRAKAYYPRRLAREAPSDYSVGEQARSALRKRFYAYAAAEIAKGYVHEDDDGHFEAYFPKLPKNTTEMKATRLYTEAVYPMTVSEHGEYMMHAWSGCPGMSAGTMTGVGAIRDMDSWWFTTCPWCEFMVSSFGKIAAATSSIETGFEYHYRIVAEAAEAYQKERAAYAPHAGRVKEVTEQLFDRVADAFEEALSYRIAAKPPGRYGAVALVANTAQAPASKSFASFVDGGGTLGAQAALSAATLLDDSSEEGASVISSLLDGVSHDSAGLAGLAGVVLDLWSSLLFAYTKGQQSLEEGVGAAIGAIPWASESGLGKWASSSFSGLIKKVGLEPVDLKARKPVLVNSAHVLGVDDSGFALRLLDVKRKYIASAGSGSGDIFSTVVSQVEAGILEGMGGLGDKITIASIELLGEGGPRIPITLALPPSVKAAAGNVVSNAAEALRAVTSSWSGIRRWE